jgi:hypothetical protein
MINSEEITYGKKIRNARQIQKFLARKKLESPTKTKKELRQAPNTLLKAEICTPVSPQYIV